MFLVVITSVTTLLFSHGVYGLGGIIPGIYSADEIAFFKKFIASKDLIKSQYYKEIDDNLIYDGAFHGMAQSLGDPYSSYLEKSENETLSNEMVGQYDGIGVYVSIDPKDNLITVVSVIKDTPASQADIRILDKIIAINGEDYTGDNINAAVEKMKGEVGEEITITVLRNSEKLEKKITKKEIVLKHLEYENKDGIGYIKILSFDENSSSDFTKAYDELASQNIKGLIIDLRDNGGGIYDETIKIAKRIIPTGLIVYTEDKNGKQEKVYSEGEGIKIPLAVLVNNSSASASEVLSGAIKDRGIGTLIGEKTFGKGLVQGWYKMTDGTALKVTVAKYFTPNGVCIEGKGIEPDIIIKNTSSSVDKQLNKAIEVLKNKLKEIEQ
jgi:carboxyl-terminal processing protease